jgi:hypothetical protein
MNAKNRWFLRVPFVVGIAAGLFPWAAALRADEAKSPEEKPDVQWVGKLDFPANLNLNDEFTVAAALQNKGPRVVLLNVRLQLPKQLRLLAPDLEQFCYIEAGATRTVKWRVKVVGEGEWQLDSFYGIISDGRPPTGSAPDVPAEDKAALAKGWTGTWEGSDGGVYDADMKLTLDASGRVDGRFDWTLKKAPVEASEEIRNYYAARIGEQGVEYFWGVYDPATRGLKLEGYRRDDPRQILGTDHYRLTLSEDRSTLSGATRGAGDWKSRFNLTPKSK